MPANLLISLFSNDSREQLRRFTDESIEPVGIDGRDPDVSLLVVPPGFMMVVLAPVKIDHDSPSHKWPPQIALTQIRNAFAFREPSR
jgi:hypothetical protein